MIKIKKKILTLALAVMATTSVMSTALATPAHAQGISGWHLEGYNTWRYVNAWFADVTGWQQIKGNWYYFNSDGLMQDAWEYIDGSWYFLGSDGAMQTGWMKDNGDWYYLGESGGMSTGWQRINRQWYYFYSNGSMAHNRAIDHYYLCSEGYWNE